MRANHYTLIVKPFPILSAAKGTLDRSKLPALTTAGDTKFPEIQRATLKNGLKVLLLERHSAPIVNITLALDAGLASDPTAKAGTAFLAMDCWMKAQRHVMHSRS